MHSRTCLFSVLAVTVVLTQAVSPAAAQTSDPSRLPKLLNTGDTIVFADATGAETRGQVAGIGDAALDLHPITPGNAANEYIVSREVMSIPIDHIYLLQRATALGGDRRPLYYRRDSFALLAERLKPRQVIRIFEPSGTETVGRIVGVSPSSLAVAARTAGAQDGSGRARYEWNTPRTFLPAGVEKIERPAPIWDGAVKGAVVAALVTTLAVVSYGCADCTGVGPAYLATTGIGAGIGLGIDALFGPQKVYESKK